MKWRSFGSKSLFGLHCMNRYESLDHPICRSSNRLCIGSTVNTNSSLLQQVRISPNRYISLYHATMHTRWYIKTRTYTHTNIMHTYTYTHTYTITYIHKYTHTYTLYIYIPAYTSIYIHPPHSFTQHTLTHTHGTHTHIHAHINTHAHIIYIYTYALIHPYKYTHN